MQEVLKVLPINLIVQKNWSNMSLSAIFKLLLEENSLLN